MWVYGIENEDDMALTYHISQGNETFDGNVLAKIIGYDVASRQAAVDRERDGFADNKRVNAGEEPYNPTNSVNFANPLNIDDRGNLTINTKSDVYTPGKRIPGPAYRAQRMNQ